jgi:hypothetical protein
LELTTARRYVVGFLTQKLIENNLIASPATNGQKAQTAHERRHRPQNHSKLAAVTHDKDLLKKVGLARS